MHIRVTKAGKNKAVRIGEERVLVGEPAYVSDEFVSRLRDEFPNFQFEELPDGQDAGGHINGDGNTDDNGGESA